jgi:hypothetical protein
MDNSVLRKKLSSYVSDKGYLKNVSDDLLYEVLVAWENWTGTSKDFYGSLGFTHRQMASLIGKAKKLRREGYFGEGDFKQVKVESVRGDEDSLPGTSGICPAVEILWGSGRVIRFAHVDLLIEFLKKAA